MKMYLNSSPKRSSEISDIKKILCPTTNIKNGRNRLPSEVLLILKLKKFPCF